MDAIVQTDEKTSGYSVLEVTVTSKEGKAIPAGVVAYLAFKVSAEAPLETIPLKHTARVLTTGDPPKPFGPLEARDGEIEVKVSDNPFYACFFYMH